MILLFIRCLILVFGTVLQAVNSQDNHIILLKNIRHLDEKKYDDIQPIAHEDIPLLMQEIDTYSQKDEVNFLLKGYCIAYGLNLAQIYKGQDPLTGSNKALVKKYNFIGRKLLPFVGNDREHLKNKIKAFVKVTLEEDARQAAPKSPFIQKLAQIESKEEKLRAIDLELAGIATKRAEAIKNQSMDSLPSLHKEEQEIIEQKNILKGRVSETPPPPSSGLFQSVWNILGWQK